MSEIMMKPIGYVHNEVVNKKDVAWGQDVSVIKLEEEYYSGLEGLIDFSHAIILYHLDKAVYDKEKHLRRRPQNREDMPPVGIFSQRGKDRPNRIGMTSVYTDQIEHTARRFCAWLPPVQCTLSGHQCMMLIQG